MKILIFNSLYWPNKVGGAEVSVGYLVEGFISRGHEVVVCCIGNEEKTYIDKNGAKVVQLKIKNLFYPFNNNNNNLIKKFIWHILDNYNLFYTRVIYDLIKDYKPDVIHTNNLCGISVVVWDIAKKFNIKLVHTSRDYYLIHPSSKISKSENLMTTISILLWSYIKKIKSKKVDIYVGISKFILEEHTKNGFFSVSKKMVIYNSQLMTNKNLILRGDSDIMKFGFIGRISPEKGLDILLEAFNKAKIKKSKLYIAGEGSPDYLSFLKEKYGNEDVEFLGRVEPENFYTIIDVNIVPSIWDEPLGRVVIEAYSYGIPSIVSNSGGMPEMVQHGITGFIYSKFEVDELVYLMKNWKEDICLNYKDTCLKQMVNYSINQIADNYLSAYTI